MYGIYAAFYPRDNSVVDDELTEAKIGRVNSLSILLRHRNQERKEAVAMKRAVKRTAKSAAKSAAKYTMKKHTIYAITDQQEKFDWKGVRYIGLSAKPAVRFEQHLACSDKSNEDKNNWIRGILAQGRTPLWHKIEEVEVKTYKQGLDREQYWIGYAMSQGAPLLNRVIRNSSNKEASTTLVVSQERISMKPLEEQSKKQSEESPQVQENNELTFHGLVDLTIILGCIPALVLCIIFWAIATAIPWGILPNIMALLITLLLSFVGGVLLVRYIEISVAFWGGKGSNMAGGFAPFACLVFVICIIGCLASAGSLEGSHYTLMALALLLVGYQTWHALRDLPQE